MDVVDSNTHQAVAAELTAPNGTYDIDLPPGTYDVTFSLAGYGGFSNYGVVVQANSTTPQNAVLQALPTSGFVAGTITNAQTGDALVGVLVEALTFPATVAGTSVSDINGDYSIELAPGTYALRFTNLGFITQTLPSVSVTVGNTTIADAALTPAPAPTTGAIAGTVTNSVTGNPVGGVQVQVIDSSSTVVGTATTDSLQGAFSFELNPGTYSVTFSKAGYFPATASAQTVVVGQTTVIEQELDPVPPNGHVSGTVTNTGGAPIPGVAIEVTGTSTAAVTDGLGQYSIELAPGSYTLAFSKEDYVGVNRSVSVASSTTTTVDVSLRLSRGALLGVVTDASGNALTDVAVQQMPSGAGTLTGADGSYDLELPTGTASVRFSKQWYQAQTFTGLTIGLDSSLTLNVTLQQSQGTLEGQVRDPHGTALGGVTITLQRARWLIVLRDDQPGRLLQLHWPLRTLLCHLR